METYWKLKIKFRKRISATGNMERDFRIDWEVAKTRILSILKQRFEQDKSGLSNAEIRQLVNMIRQQVIRLMKELIDENPDIPHPGRGKYARYYFKTED